MSQSIKKWPNAPEFYEMLAATYLQQKATGKAIAVINKALEAIPDNIRLNIMLASTYEQIGDYAKAVKIYDALVTRYPTIDLAVNNLVSLLLDHFDTPENSARALSLAKRFEHSEQPVYADSYAWALIKSGDSKEALNLLREIVKKKPDVPVFRYHLGTAYYLTNSKTQAITELQEALKLGEKTGGFIEKKTTEKLLLTIKEST